VKAGSGKTKKNLDKEPNTLSGPLKKEERAKVSSRPQMEKNKRGIRLPISYPPAKVKNKMGENMLYRHVYLRRRESF